MKTGAFFPIAREGRDEHEKTLELEISVELMGINTARRGSQCTKIYETYMYIILYL